MTMTNGVTGGLLATSCQLPQRPYVSMGRLRVWNGETFVMVGMGPLDKGDSFRRFIDMRHVLEIVFWLASLDGCGTYIYPMKPFLVG